MRFHPPSPRRAQPGRIHCTAPPPYLIKPPLDHLADHLSLHHSTNLESFFSITSSKPASIFLHRLGLRRCGGGGSAAHCFDAQPRTLLFCRHHSSITPRCNRAPGHTPHAVVWLEKRAFTVVSPKKIAKITAPPDRGQGALSNPRSFRYRQTHTTTTAQTSISDGHTMALSGLTGGRSRATSVHTNVASLVGRTNLVQNPGTTLVYPQFS